MVSHINIPLDCLLSEAEVKSTGSTPIGHSSVRSYIGMSSSSSVLKALRGRIFVKWSALFAVPYSPVEGSGLGLRLCIVCLHASQCSQWLCFSRRLMQRMSQEAVGGMGQWVVETWPTVHSNNAPKMGAVRNLAHAGALLRIGWTPKLKP